ncbi:urate hydroxylase PuuD [Moritella sp. 28]|uniref:urate hydroxylase PuuD n=1 Tax=Moritella sp. 28 TaxID=2746232 RepID=UPI001BA65FF7|nr:urate hydroxylase PuuD [Moritella sp. 28]QUM85925.1 urate hydroxylase PuuD [Moritella sp. 28]
MDPHITEWLNLAIRWMHMIFGIAWIGASFYFVWLENHLNRTNPKTGLAGDLWAIHGGGIYHLEKYKLAPEKMPETLHWFKWEAYTTFLSGISLLTVVYYFNAQSMLIAPGSGLTEWQGIAIGIATIVVGWIVYHLLCESPLAQRPALMGAVLMLMIIAVAYGLSLVFTGRAAYIHVGAMIGSLMVGNVFFVIMPGQRKMVAAVSKGEQPDPKDPAKALLRSRHNNYLTLPVLFIMISNHFPSTYGSEYNWLILAAVSIISVLVRHYFNTRHQHQKYAWTLPFAAFAMITLAFITKPTVDNSAPQVAFSEVQSIVAERCAVCHATAGVAPMAGVHLDTAENIKLNSDRVLSAVRNRVMPQGNITKMTDDERIVVINWINQGAKI